MSSAPNLDLHEMEGILFIFLLTFCDELFLMIYLFLFFMCIDRCFTCMSVSVCEGGRSLGTGVTDTIEPRSSGRVASAPYH